MDYTRTITLQHDFDQSVAEVKEAFRAKGFGTLTEIDVRATLKEKIGADIEPYLILGTCNPVLAHRAIDAEPQIGTLLPCNVVVRQRGDAVVVDALDPAVMVGVTENPALGPIAEEAARLVGEALVGLSEAEARLGPTP